MRNKSPILLALLLGTLALSLSCGSDKGWSAKYQDLNRYDLTELEELRNEIYARHGKVFDTKTWNKYFTKKSWYKPDPNFSEESLSNQEREWISGILARESLAFQVSATRPKNDLMVAFMFNKNMGNFILVEMKDGLLTQNYLSNTKIVFTRPDFDIQQVDVVWTKREDLAGLYIRKKLKAVLDLNSMKCYVDGEEDIPANLVQRIPTPSGTGFFWGKEWVEIPLAALLLLLGYFRFKAFKLRQEQRLAKESVAPDIPPGSPPPLPQPSRVPWNFPRPRLAHLLTFGVVLCVLVLALLLPKDLPLRVMADYEAGNFSPEFNGFIAHRMMGEGLDLSQDGRARGFLADCTGRELKIARNAIYAKHSHRFRTKVKTFFGGDPHENVPETTLTELDHANVAFIQGLEKKALPESVEDAFNRFEKDELEKSEKALAMEMEKATNPGWYKGFVADNDLSEKPRYTQSALRLDQGDGEDSVWIIFQTIRSNGQYILSAVAWEGGLIRSLLKLGPSQKGYWIYLSDRDHTEITKDIGWEGPGTSPREIRRFWPGENGVFYYVQTMDVNGVPYHHEYGNTYGGPNDPEGEYHQSSFRELPVH